MCPTAPKAIVNAAFAASVAEPRPQTDLTGHPSRAAACVRTGTNGVDARPCLTGATPATWRSRLGPSRHGRISPLVHHQLGETVPEPVQDLGHWLPHVKSRSAPLRLCRPATDVSTPWAVEVDRHPRCGRRTLRQRCQLSACCLAVHERHALDDRRNPRPHRPAPPPRTQTSCWWGSAHGCLRHRRPDHWDHPCRR